MEPDAALPTSPDVRQGVASARWTVGDRWLTGAVLGIFLANLVVSLALPPTVQWSGGPVQHYLIHLALALSGLLLVLVPASALVAVAQRHVEGTLGAMLFLWFLAVLAMATVVLYVRDVPAWRRVAYAYLIGAQVTGFAAVHWSTLGS